jgi:hypothetical protein
MNIGRPNLDEYAPYYHQNVSQVGTDDVLNCLAKAKTQTSQLLQTFTAEQWAHRYATGKWSIAEVMIHVMDAERIFAYLGLCIARGDQTPLPGFEQDDYIQFCGATERSGTSIVEEYLAMREANLQLFSNFSAEMWHRRGVASDKSVSARAIAFIIAGHEIHHLKVLKDRYL